MSLSALPPLRDVIAAFDLGARKALGQHFLLDLNLTGRIARVAGDLSDVSVLEVGPGPGGLTRAILETNALQVVAVERDSRCIAALQPLVKAAAGRLTLLEADALSFDWAAQVPSPRAVIANLPYNVATPLLLGWLRQAEVFVSLTLMFQKEVAERLAASPRTKAYGRLSVMTQWRTEARMLFDIPARAFTPPPNVVSSVIQLLPRPLAADDPTWQAMETVTAAAFGQRRKMLRAGLKTLLPDPLPLLAQAAIAPEARAEELTVHDFKRLARCWAAITPEN